MKTKLTLTINRFPNKSADPDKPSINEQQKDNPVFKYLSPPDKYFKLVDNQIPDFIIPKQRLMILFIYLSYYESKPNHLEEQLIKMNEQKVYKDYQNKMMILLLDKEDNMNYIQEIQFALIPYRIKLFLFWSYEEMSQFLKKLIEKQ